MSAYHGVLAVWIAIALIAYVGLRKKPAPYGRHRSDERGGVPSRIAWIVMELPSAISFAAVAMLCSRAHEAWWQGRILFVMWELHYLNRGLVYPLRVRSTKRVPIWVVLSAFVFTSVNGALNAWALFGVGPELGLISICRARFLLGGVLFVAGMWLNIDSDNRLLRNPRGPRGEYSIPTGGFYRYVSSPNYLGELIEWLGFAIASGSSAALAFFLWSAANLVPRAVANHAWYRRQFPDYPRERTALIPRGITVLLALVVLAATAHAESCPANWKSNGTTGNIVACQRDVPGSAFREHRVAITLDSPPAKVMQLLWQDVLDKHDEGLAARQFLRREDRLLVIYDQIHAPVVSDRDYTARVDRFDDPRTGGGEVRFTLANELGPPPSPHHVRIPVLRASFVVESNGRGGSHVIYVTFSEPGGSVPAFLVRNAIQKRVLADVLDLEHRLARQ